MEASTFSSFSNLVTKITVFWGIVINTLILFHWLISLCSMMIAFFYFCYNIFSFFLYFSIPCWVSRWDLYPVANFSELGAEGQPQETNKSRYILCLHKYTNTQFRGGIPFRDPIRIPLVLQYRCIFKGILLVRWEGQVWFGLVWKAPKSESITMSHNSHSAK